MKLLMLLAASACAACAGPYSGLESVVDRLQMNQGMIAATCAGGRAATPVQLQFKAASCRKLFESRGVLLTEMEPILIHLTIDPPTAESLERMRAAIPALTEQLRDADAKVGEVVHRKKKAYPLDVFRLQAAATALRFTRIEVAEIDNQLRNEQVSERPRMRRLLVALRKQREQTELWARRLAFAEEVYYIASNQPHSPVLQSRR